MVIEAKEETISEVDLKRLLGGQFVYVGYPDNSLRNDSGLTNAQIAFLNSEGTHNSKASKTIHKSMESGLTYSNAFIAYIRSNGEPRWHIPPRKFLEPAIEKAIKTIHNQIKKIALLTIENKNPDIEVDKLGIKAVNAVKRFIRNYPENELTPNAPSTIKRKGEDHPLKGKTGQLLNGVTYVKGN